MPPDGSLTPSFVGREHEMRLLRRAFEESAAGSGRIVLLSGEPGIGKTRVAQQLLSHASRAGATVLAGRCHDGDGAPAYWPWAQVFRAYVQAPDASTLRAHLRDAAPELAVALPALREWLPEPPSAAIHDSPAARFRLFDGVTTLLRLAARQRPLVIFLDDLHCADLASLRLLEFVVRDSADVRLLLVGTCRDTELPPGAAGETLLDIARHGEARTLHLPGLDDEAVGQLLREITGRTPHPTEVTRIHRETAGNPFFVIELGRLLADEACDAECRVTIPPGVQGVIHRRLARLSAACNEVLGVAAVLGADFDVSVLARACPYGDDLVDRALDEATAAELLTRAGCSTGRLRFKHVLVRETVYRALERPHRALLHGRIAAVLEHDDAARPDPPLGEIAHHFLHAATAADWERGIAYAERAACRALRRFAYEEAAVHYRCALAALDRARPAHGAYRCSLFLGLGRAHLAAGEATEARAAFRNAADIARSLRDAEQLARAALGYSARADPRVVNPDVVALLEEAVATTPDGASALRAQILARLAREMSGSGAAALGRQAVELAHRLGDPTVLTTVLIDARFARWGPDDLPERLEDTNEILRAAESTRSLEPALTARLFRVIDLLELGRIADVDHELAVLATGARELRQPWYLEHATALQAMRARLAGRYDEAEDLARRALELGVRVHDPTAASTYAGHRLDMDRERGDLAQHETGVRQLAVEYPRLGLIRYVPPWLYAELGRHAEARCELERVAAYDFADVPRDMNCLGSLALLAEAAADLGDRQRAALLTSCCARMPSAWWSRASGRSARGARGSISVALRQPSRAGRTPSATSRPPSTRIAAWARCPSSRGRSTRTRSCCGPAGGRVTPSRRGPSGVTPGPPPRYSG
jgi:tetratricopeptide (TPR) repeat protein